MIPVSSVSSSSSLSSSQVAISPTLLSASRNARTCSGVRSSATIQGHVSRPSFLAALSRVCPFTMILFLSITIGTLKPNSWMLLATAGTALSFFRGLFSYGMSSPTFLSTIFISHLVLAKRKGPGVTGAFSQKGRFCNGGTSYLPRYYCIMKNTKKTPENRLKNARKVLNSVFRAVIHIFINLSTGKENGPLFRDGFVTKIHAGHGFDGFPPDGPAAAVAPVYPGRYGFPAFPLDEPELEDFSFCVREGIHIFFQGLQSLFQLVMLCPFPLEIFPHFFFAHTFSFFGARLFPFP